MSDPTPGWYRDPDPSSDAGQERYWDGGAWTTNVRPGPSAGWGQPGVARQAAGSTPNRQTRPVASRSRRKLIVPAAIAAVVATCAAVWFTRDTRDPSKPYVFDDKTVAEMKARILAGWPHRNEHALWAPGHDASGTEDTKIPTHAGNLMADPIGPPGWYSVTVTVYGPPPGSTCARPDLDGIDVEGGKVRLRMPLRLDCGVGATQYRFVLFERPTSVSAPMYAGRCRRWTIGSQWTVVTDEPTVPDATGVCPF